MPLGFLLVLLASASSLGCRPDETPVGRFCLCRVHWTCEGDACQEFKQFHITTTGSVIGRVGYERKCRGCSCQAEPARSVTNKLVGYLHDSSHQHLYGDDRYDKTILQTFGASSQPAMSLERCEELLGQGSERCKRKILGVGTSKTGTTTIANLAASLLNSPNGHFQHPFVELDQVRIPAFPGMTSGLAPDMRLTHEHMFMDDMPMNLFFDEFAHYYPRALFLFSERDMQSWVASLHAHLERNSPLPSSREFGRLLTYATNNITQQYPFQYTLLRHMTTAQTLIHPSRIMHTNIINTMGQSQLETHEICFLLTQQELKCEKASLPQANVHGSYAAAATPAMEAIADTRTTLPSVFDEA